MAVQEVVFTQRLAGQDVQMRFHFLDLAIFPGTAGVAADLANAFQVNVVPLINALQSDEISNVSVYAREFGNPGGAVTIASAGQGLVDSTAALTLPTDMPVFWKVGLSGWIDAVSGAAYTSSRPGAAGRKFVPGLTEDWIDVSGAGVPPALIAAFEALEDELEAAIPTTTPTANWRFGTFTPAKTASGGLPARNALFSYFSGFTVRRATRLLSRRP